jgi:hypothetical protein
MQAAQLGTLCLEFRDRVRHRLACHIIETNDKGTGANGHDRHIYIRWLKHPNMFVANKHHSANFFEPSSSDVIREACPSHVPITRPIEGSSVPGSLERSQRRVVEFRGRWVAQRDLEFDMWSTGLPRDQGYIFAEKVRARRPVLVVLAAQACLPIPQGTELPTRAVATKRNTRSCVEGALLKAWTRTFYV